MAPDRRPNVAPRPGVGPAGADVALAVQHHRSIRSIASAYSFGSVASVASIGSIASAGSILSIGSAGSILSIGSSGSILSIGSAGSILSIGAAGSIRSNPTQCQAEPDCRPNRPNAAVAVALIGLAAGALALAAVRCR